MMVDEVAVARGSVFFYGVGHMLNDITAACWFTYLLVWHGAGSILVAVSFSSVFGGCVPCIIFGNESSSLQTIGYSFFAAVFNVGWAATQVANLSLYAIAFSVFHIRPSKTTSDVENQYRWIAYSSIFIGCCFVVVFHIGTKEPRLITNVSQAFLAFYVINDLRMAQSSKALVRNYTNLLIDHEILLSFRLFSLPMKHDLQIPAMIYICSFIVSIILQELTWTGQRLKAFFSVGGVLWILCGSAIFFMPRSMKDVIYLVGEDVKGCAFVYGSLSFLDKMSCGIALWALESYQMYTCFSVSRYGLGLVPAICALAGVIVTCTMKLEKPRLKPLRVPLLE
ncbi:hypothetical protein Ccrd_008675, partial [Cynara cardunculus var. scolymus]